MGTCELKVRSISFPFLILWSFWERKLSNNIEILTLSLMLGRKSTRYIRLLSAWFNFWIKVWIINRAGPRYICNRLTLLFYWLLWNLIEQLSISDIHKDYMLLWINFCLDLIKKLLHVIAYQLREKLMLGWGTVILSYTHRDFISNKIHPIFCYCDAVYIFFILGY